MDEYGPRRGSKPSRLALPRENAGKCLVTGFNAGLYVPGPGVFSENFNKILFIFTIIHPNSFTNITTIIVTKLLVSESLKLELQCLASVP